ncbi:MULTISPECIES: metal ABC transporter permease [unclassified Meiothermus]|uniref:metal ABC transporter permease n=1 Tax=unclassified Meiothermus TaxID=370471 RepID=UPI000D7C196D|nr:MULTISPECIES: metal ABC transporter permease [unclassified Meiothermus]PZA06976.1 metal ABC transporter permease [Meiothermus sp. Pnk-1]RYM38368.1 metal ABC transporter permease [Meiothermus sp. PNK-Is4]
MLEALAFPFFQRALLAGVLVGAFISYYAPFVVQRKLSFLSHGLAHAAFGGVAIALFFNTEPLWVALPFTVLVALGITWVRSRTGLAEDSAIGIFLALALALGILILSFRSGYAAEALAYLFGSLLAVTPTDLWISLGVLGLTLALLPAWGRWAYVTFDRDLALADRRRVLLQDYLLSALVAVATVVAVKVVGALLVGAFLVIPAATARLWSRTFATMTLLSVVLGVATALVGLALSYQLNVPSGASIVLVQGVVFAVAFATGQRERVE